MTQNTHNPIGSLFVVNRHRMATDGDGVTTLVAFHGCPLRCRYCLNPQSLDPQFECRKVTVEELIEEVRIDDLYFQATCGGITFGGGEPLLHSTFIRRFCELRPDYWRICIETCLNVPLSHLQEVAPFISQWFIDIKDINPDTYQQYTSRHNQQVIDNLRWLASQPGMAHRVTLRIPRIPGFNDVASNEKSQAFLQSIGFSKFDRFCYITNISPPRG